MSIQMDFYAHRLKAYETQLALGVAFATKEISNVNAPAYLSQFKLRSGAQFEHRQRSIAVGL
jgi:hypothetical protein